MKRNIWNSLQIKLVLYSVVSLCLALITEIGIGIVLYSLSTMMGASSSGYGFQPAPPDMGRVPEPRLQGGGVWSAIHQIERMERGTLYTIIVAGVIVGMLLFIMYFLWLSRKIIQDLSHISNRITSIARGNLDEIISVDRQDEIGEIANRVNEMTEEIVRLMQSEREALQTNKDLITCVAHDLRTPLTSVIGYLQLARDTEKYDEEKRQQFTQIASEKASRLEGLIEDLFSYTKLMSGEITLHRCEIDIVKLLEQMVEEFYPLFQDNYLECLFVKNIDGINICLDPELIARAIQNLLSNAVKYGKDGKQILVSVEKMSEEIKIHVTNYGLIIPKESLDMIFEKFYRVEESRSRKTGGTGLGLNIAKEIIVLHGGSISVESGQQGTIFTVSLPLSV